MLNQQIALDFQKHFAEDETFRSALDPEMAEFETLHDN